MKIVCISDTHNHHQELTQLLPAGDMLIHAGDMAIHGSVNEVQNFLDWFASLPHRYKLLVGGNHDGALEHTKDQLSIPSNLYYLENQSVCIEGLKIWGSPLSPPYRSMGFMWEDAKRAEIYRRIPTDCDIIINHSPAYHCLDRTREGLHVGCPLLAARIALLDKPRLVVCGHIHEAYGMLQQNGTLYVNASSMTSRYQPANPPICVELI